MAGFALSHFEEVANYVRYIVHFTTHESRKYAITNTANRPQLMFSALDLSAAARGERAALALLPM